VAALTTPRISRSIPAARHAAVVEQILALAATDGHITARPARSLRRALRDDRLVVAFDGEAVAFDGEAVVGWFLSEPCGPGVHELGFIFVHPSVRGDAVFIEMLNLALAIEGRAVSVTFRADFAGWLIRSKGFRRVGLGEATRLSRGWFLLRRLAPGRLGTALRRTSSGEAWYLVYERPR